MTIIVIFGVFQVEKYVDEASRKSDLERTELQKDKTGVFTGVMAKNPANGEAIPIWVADYVLGRCEFPDSAASCCDSVSLDLIIFEVIFNGSGQDIYGNVSLFTCDGRWCLWTGSLSISLLVLKQSIVDT